MSDALQEYMVQLVMATRQPQQYDDKLAQYIALGVSPRATIALDKCARAHAWLMGRDLSVPIIFMLYFIMSCAIVCH